MPSTICGVYAQKGSANFVALKHSRALSFTFYGSNIEEVGGNGMICFQVEINGKKLCTAGVGEFGVLTTVVSLVRNRQAHSATDDIPEAQLKVGGTTSLSDNVHENVVWTSSSLKVGDELRIVITDQLQPDDPTERTTRDPALELERTKAHYEWLITELEKEVESRDRT